MIASPASSTRHSTPAQTAILLFAKCVLTLVAAFWAWFAAMHLFGNDEGARQGSLLPVLLITTSMALIATSSWVIPRAGGVMAILGACAAAYFFRGPWGSFGIALPIALTGLTIFILSGRRHS